MNQRIPVQDTGPKRFRWDIFKHHVGEGVIPLDIDDSHHVRVVQHLEYLGTMEEHLAPSALSGIVRFHASQNDRFLARPAGEGDLGHATRVESPENRVIIKFDHSSR